MGPFTFLNGAFLAALAVAALPVLIHLFSRRRATERPFSHLELLDEITKKKIRRMKLRQWLLLALRTLAIALLALALSRPVWHGAGAHDKRGSSTVAILIDDSYSMGARLDPGAVLPVDTEGSSLAAPTRFEEARQRALQIIDLLEEGDRAVLVFTASPVRVPYESTVRDRSLLRDELLRAHPRATRSNLVAGLERVYPILATAQTLNREIFVVSDFQEHQMEEILRGVTTVGGAPRGASGGSPAGGGDRVAGDDAGAAAAERAEAADPADPRAGSGRPTASAESTGRGPALDPAAGEASAASLPSLVPTPPDTRLYVLPIVAPSGPNVAVVWALFERDPGGAGGRVTIRVRNFSDIPVEEQVLQVLDGQSGALLAEGFVSVDADAVTQTMISIEETPDAGLLMVRSGSDLLEIDNTRYLSTTTTNRFRVLIVTGGPLDDPAVYEDATFPILALDPWSGAAVLAQAAGRDRVAGAPHQPHAEDAGSESLRLFEASLIAEGDLGLETEIEADAVLLLNVGRLSASAAELLERYRSEGGGIFIALGDRVDARVYNNQILPRLAGMRLENVRGDLRGDAHFSLRPAVAGHDIFDGFPVAPGEALSSARFQRLLELRPGAQTRVLAEFSGGYPALAEEPGLLLFASALDLRWSDFPTSASYLPFLHRGLLHLILEGKVGRQDPTVGLQLRHPLAGELEGESFRCVGPRGIELPVEVILGDRGSMLQTAPLPEAGFYMLGTSRAALGIPASSGTVPDALAGRVPITTEAVNLDTRESDLRPLDGDQLRYVFGSQAQLINPEQALSRQVLEARYGRELWQLCLTLAFLLLLAESIIGRGRLRR